MHRQPHRADPETNAFTRLELAVVIAMVAILSALVIPSLAASRSDANGIICLNNKRLLMRGWQMYTADFSENMPGVVHGGIADGPPPTTPIRAWCVGWLTWDNAYSGTNLMYLLDPRYSQLTRYISSNRFLYRCPADRYISAAQKRFGIRERIRSISGNVMVGEGNGDAGPIDAKFAHARLISDLVKPSPANVYMYLDEHPDSINDAAFFSPRGSPGSLEMVDFPAAFHEGSVGLSFTDGHAELHRWQALQKVPITANNLFPPANLKAQSDAQYLYDHTPQK